MRNCRNEADLSDSYPSGHALPVDASTEKPSQPANLDFFHLFWIFILASVVGLFVETLVSYPLDGVWKDRAGLVWGPFSPIYGVASVLATVALARFSDVNPLFLFVTSAIAGGLFEFVAGWALFLAIDIALALVALDCWFERESGRDTNTPAQAFFAEQFGDNFMESRFQTMSIYPSLAMRESSTGYY